MITLACVTCHLAMRTTGDPAEVDFLVGMRSEWYPDRYPCPRSGCGGQMTLTDVIDSNILPLLEVHDLTPQECFQALHGLGLPAERECTPEALAEVMVGKTITRIDVQRLNNDRRSAIHSISLSDGIRIFFGASPQGAIIYRIAPPRSLTSEVLNGG